MMFYLFIVQAVKIGTVFGNNNLFLLLIIIGLIYGEWVCVCVCVTAFSLLL